MQNELALSPSAQGKLMKKWDKILNYSSKNVRPLTESRQRLNTAVLLENQEKWCLENTIAAGAPGGGGVFGNTSLAGLTNSDSYATGDARLPKVLIPMVRRAFPELISQEIVGVQPMTGPVGLAFALRYKYQAQSLGVNGLDGQNFTNTARPAATAADGQELGYQLLDNRYTGANGAATLTGLSSTQYIPGLSGQWTQIGADQGLAEVLANYEATGQIPQITITLEKTAVTAGTRRLAATWSVELEQDLKNMNGLDVDTEIVNAMSYELQAEIDREMIMRMLQICWNAGPGQGWSVWSPQTADGRWLMERNRDIYSRIVTESNKIAVRNRRGSANFIVVTPTVSAMLEQLKEFTWAPVDNNIDSTPVGIAKIGTLAGRYKVYRDTRTEGQYQAGLRANPIDYVLMGYKGPQYYDTGIVYCPYIPVMVQRTQGPNDFAPRVGLMTRYGVVDNIFGASLYYHCILVQGLNTLFDPATRVAPTSGNGGVMFF